MLPKKKALGPGLYQYKDKKVSMVVYCSSAFEKAE